MFPARQCHVAKMAPEPLGYISLSTIWLGCVCSCESNSSETVGTWTCSRYMKQQVSNVYPKLNVKNSGTNKCNTCFDIHRMWFWLQANMRESVCLSSCLLWFPVIFPVNKLDETCQTLRSQESLYGIEALQATSLQQLSAFLSGFGAQARNAVEIL